MSTLTKKSLEKSLKQLLLVKPLNKITINEISNNCGINRMTFYYHFSDIYDLVEWSCAEDARKVLEDKKTYETWDQGFLQIFEAVIENRVFIINVYNCVSREQVEKYLYEVTYHLLINVVKEKSIGIDVKEEDQKFIADFYKYGFVGLVLDWIKNGMEEEPSKIIERLKTLIHGDIEKSLENYRIDK